MASQNWSTKAVLKQLYEEAVADGTAAAQIFLHGKTEENLAEKVVRIVDAAVLVAGKGSDSIHIGRISSLAQSFSLKADPAIFEALAQDERVKSILPSVVTDIYPKPTNQSRSRS